jgi:hypothetical protein
MADDARDRPTLPAERAFVVMLRGDCRPTADDLRGRIEHVRSGRTTHFASLAELVAFLAAMTDDDD